MNSVYSAPADDVCTYSLMRSRLSNFSKGRGPRGRHRPQGLDPPDDGVHVWAVPDGRLPAGSRGRGQPDRHERRLCHSLELVQGVPCPDADAHILGVRPAEAGQLWVIAPPPGLHIWQLDGGQAALCQGNRLVYLFVPIYSFCLKTQEVKISRFDAIHSDHQ